MKAAPYSPMSYERMVMCRNLVASIVDVGGKVAFPDWRRDVGELLATVDERDAQVALCREEMERSASERIAAVAALSRLREVAREALDAIKNLVEVGCGGEHSDCGKAGCYPDVVAKLESALSSKEGAK